MARDKGGFKFASNFEVKIQGLLDPRQGVENKEDLINKETFPYDGDTIYMKEGMLVTVSSTQEVYMLVSLQNILADDYSGWKLINQSGDSNSNIQVVETAPSELPSDRIVFIQDEKTISVNGTIYKSVNWSILEEEGEEGEDSVDVQNGIYIVTAKGKFVDPSTVDPTAIGVALITDNQKIMIAKADATDGTNNTLYWGNNLKGKDVAGITQTTKSSVAKTDFNGKANTDAIIAAYGQHSVDMDSRDMCKVLATYAEGGFTDWYVPSAGQLYEMYTNKTDINTALANIGGTAFESDAFQSSSEYDATAAWCVYFRYGDASRSSKNSLDRVRFIRDIA